MFRMRLLAGLGLQWARLPHRISPHKIPLHLKFVRAKSGTSSRRWVTRQTDDYHSKKAKLQGYRSRAAYKLLELDLKFNLIGRSTKNIVDLGFAPGAWTQVVLGKLATLGVKSHRVVGVDLLNCSPPEGSHFIQGDIFSKTTHQEIRALFDNQPVDLLMSDMMANTSGIKDNDHYASMDLCDGVMVLACDFLRKNGTLVMKFYTGKEDAAMQAKLSKVFHKVFRAKPQACRAELREMYFVATNKKRDKVDLSDLFGQS